nr:HNH endonuclease [Vibrio coralliirubri]
MRLHANHTEKDLEGTFKAVTNALKRVLTTIGEVPFYHRSRGFDQRALVATTAWFNANKDLVLTNGLGDRIRESFEEAKADRDFRSPAIQVKTAIILEYLDSCLDHNPKRLDPNRRYSRAFGEQLFNSSKDKCCAICNNKILNFDDCDVDHRTPWALGGRTDEANAQLTHNRCNRQKGTKESFNA